MKKIFFVSLTSFLLFVLIGFNGCSVKNNSSEKWIPKVAKEFGKFPKFKWIKDPSLKKKSNTQTDSDNPPEPPDPAQDEDNPSAKYYKPPTETKTVVLSKGNGRVLHTGDSVFVNYYGITYGGDMPFDTSFLPDRDPLSFQIGSQQTIQGFSKGLDGQTTGSRVLVSIPPVDGYGQAGNQDAGISGTTVIEFIIDIIASYPNTLTINPKKSKFTNLKTQVNVTGSLNSEPKMSLKEGAKEVNSMVTTVIAKGDSKKIQNNNYAIISYKSETWSGQPHSNTYTNNSFDFQKVKTIKNNKGTMFSALNGIPINSRVLVQTPEKENSYPGLITVIDVLGQIPPSAVLPKKYIKYNKEKATAMKREIDRQQQLASKMPGYGQSGGGAGGNGLNLG